MLATCAWLKKYGFQVTRLELDKTGRLDPGELESAINEKTCLVSIMLANNETGSVQPVAEMARICRQRGLLFHTDATQAAGILKKRVSELFQYSKK